MFHDNVRSANKMILNTCPSRGCSNIYRVGAGGLWKLNTNIVNIVNIMNIVNMSLNLQTQTIYLIFQTFEPLNFENLRTQRCFQLWRVTSDSLVTRFPRYPIDLEDAETTTLKAPKVETPVAPHVLTLFTIVLFNFTCSIMLVNSVKCLYDPWRSWNSKGFTWLIVKLSGYHFAMFRNEEIRRFGESPLSPFLGRSLPFLLGRVCSQMSSLCFLPILPKNC